MSNTQLLATVIIGSFGAIMLVRVLMKRGSGAYHRRFNGEPLQRPNDAPQRDDTAFPFASTLYLGDGGASASQHQNPADCAHPVDVGGGCSSDGGGGGSQ